MELIGFSLFELRVAGIEERKSEECREISVGRSASIGLSRKCSSLRYHIEFRSAVWQQDPK